MIPPIDPDAFDGVELCDVCHLEACEDPSHLPPELDPIPEEPAPISGRPVSDRDDRFAETVYRQEKARRQAKRRLDLEDGGPILTPEFLTLAELVAEPEAPVRWRIEGWQPADTRVVLAATRKSGKTTLIASLVRSLVDGDPWLGHAAVTPITGTVAILDTEMSRSQLKRWLALQRVEHADRVIVVPLRGCAATLDLLEPDCRARWLAWLRARDVSYLIIDCLRPVLDALGLDESREAGRWLVPLDALLREAAIPEACVVHHMGHTGERSRGDSRLRDWPDVEWRVMRQEEDDASPRFIAAYGRDVDVPEAGLLFDRATRRLTLHVGSRHQARTARALVAILAILAQKAPLTGRAIKAELTESDHKRDTIDAALKAGVRGGTLIAETGPRNARLYRAAVSECPEVSDGTPGHSLADRVSECPSAFSKADTPDTPSLPLGGSLDPDATPTKPDTRKTKGRTNTPRTRKAATRNTPRSRRAGGGAQ